MGIPELGKVLLKLWRGNLDREVCGDGHHHHHHGSFAVSVFRGYTTEKVVVYFMLHPSIETRIV